MNSIACEFSLYTLSTCSISCVGLAVTSNYVNGTHAVHLTQLDNTASTLTHTDISRNQCRYTTAYHEWKLFVSECEQQVMCLVLQA